MDPVTVPDIHKLNGKRILITGASGFIGSNLVKHLSHTSAEVFGTSRHNRESSIPNFTWMECAADDYESVDQLFHAVNPDIIFHLAGEVTGSQDIKYVQSTFHSLVASTVNILTIATKRGCERVVLMGSCREPEHTELPDSPYAAAKSSGSIYANMFWNCYQTPVVTVRTFVTYGPGQPTKMLIPHVILSLLNNESPKLSSGKWETDWIYIDDVVEGMIAAAVVPDVEGSTVDLATGVLTSVKDVVETIKENIETNATPLFGALPDRKNEHIRVADTEATFEKLKWRAKTTLAVGLVKTIQSIRNSVAMRVSFVGHSLTELIASECYWGLI